MNKRVNWNGTKLTAKELRRSEAPQLNEVRKQEAYCDRQ